MLLNGHVGLDVEPLSITSGVVWTALNIDYPGHSFSHLGVFRGATYCFAESSLSIMPQRRRTQWTVTKSRPPELIQSHFSAHQ